MEAGTEMWDLGGWHKALGQTVERETEALPKQIAKTRRKTIPKNSDTDNTKMVVLEACV